MDTHKKSSFLNYAQHTLPPAQLWIGRHDHAIKEIELFLQKMFCTNNGCNTCITCMNIREKQHHALMWLHPEKNYTLDQLDDLFSTLSFQLQPDELFFFIIQKADYLTAACANKLLKPMEEPPRGYHFILLAEHTEQILPTIRSRCVVSTLENATTAHNMHPLYENFTQRIVPIEEFSKMVDSANINERESKELLDQIIHYWLTLYKKNNSIPENNTPAMVSIITTLQQALLRPPMPGSSTTFWRNLYLQLREDLIEIK